MKLVINNKEYNVDLTEHKTTQDEQLEVFWGEMDEFDRALYIEDKYCVAQECIDCIKSLAKWFKNMDRYEVKSSPYDIHDVIDKININIRRFKTYKDYENGAILLNCLVWFLEVYCFKSGLNLTEQFKINNDKTNNRGTKKKVYLSDEEIIDLIENSNKLLNCGFPELAQKQQNIIDKIEG